MLPPVPPKDPGDPKEKALDELIFREIELDRRKKKPKEPPEPVLVLPQREEEEPPPRKTLKERIETARVNRDAGLERRQLKIQRHEQQSRTRHAATLQFAEECGASGVQRFRKAWREKEKKVERLLEAQALARATRIAENAKREVDVKKTLRDNRKEFDLRPAKFEAKLAAKFERAERCREVLGQEGRSSRYAYGFRPEDGKTPGEREPEPPVFKPADHYNESAEKFGPTWLAAMEDEKANRRLDHKRSALTFTPKGGPEPRPVSRSSRGSRRSGSKGSDSSPTFPSRPGSRERPSSREFPSRPHSRERSNSPSTTFAPWGSTSTFPPRSPGTSAWGSESLRTLNPHVVVEVRDRPDPTLRAAEWKAKKQEEDWAHRQELIGQSRKRLSDAKARRTGLQNAKKQELKKAAKELEARVKSNFARKRQQEEEVLEEAREAVLETQEKALLMEQLVLERKSAETKRRVEANAAHVQMLRDRRQALQDLMVMTAHLKLHVDEQRIDRNQEQIFIERQQEMDRKEKDRLWRHRMFHERREGFGGTAKEANDAQRQATLDRVAAARRRRSGLASRGRFLGENGRLLKKWRSSPRLMSETWGPGWGDADDDDDDDRASKASKVKEDYSDAELEEVLEAELADYLAQDERRLRRGSDLKPIGGEELRLEAH